MSMEESIFDLQKEAGVWVLVYNAFILFFHNAVIGFNNYYAGVTLPYHKVGEYGYLQLTEEESTWYLSLHPLTILVGSVLSNPAGERLGRKKVLILTNVITMISFTMMNYATGFTMLLTGRMLSGLALGLGILIPFVHMSEISTIRLKPVLATCMNLSIGTGVLMFYMFNMALSPTLLPYIVIIFAFLFIVAAIFLPESPHWLIRKGDIQRAETILRALRGKQYRGVDQEIKEVLSIVKGDVSSQESSRWRNRAFLCPLGILIALFSSIGLSGMDAPLNLYGPRMFSEFGFDIPYRYIMLPIPTGCVLGFLVSAALVNFLDKRTHCIWAGLAMAVSCGILSVAYLTKELNGGVPTSLSQVYLCIGSLGLTFGYGAGYGAVIYSLPGDLLAPQDKTVGISVAHTCRMLWTAALIKLYPTLLDTFGYPAMFGFHAVILIASALFIFRFLPETKNKSLSEIQLLFTKNTYHGDV